MTPFDGQAGFSGLIAEPGDRAFRIQGQNRRAQFTWYPPAEYMNRVSVVDDDPSARGALVRLLQSAGHETAGFGSAWEFMEAGFSQGTGCAVLETTLPGITGLELQAWLEKTQSAVCVVFVTAHADVAMSVRAMKAGAVDFLTKPAQDSDLLRAVEQALIRSRAEFEQRRGRVAAEKRLSTLTPRELAVLERLVAGRLNKEIAADLGAAERTIKGHRAQVMRKMGVQSLAQLVHVAGRLGVGGPG